MDQLMMDPAKQMLKYIGKMKGIQGHNNSSYIDSIVFGLFALSDVFDTMLLETKMMADQKREAISSLLREGIVNPLRKYGSAR